MEMTKELADDLSEALEAIWQNYGGSIKKVASRLEVPDTFVWKIRNNKHRSQSTIKDENVEKLFACLDKQVNSDITFELQTGPGVGEFKESDIDPPDDQLVLHVDRVEQLRLIKAEALAALAAYNTAVAGAREHGGKFLLAELDGERTGELKLIKLEMKVSI